MPKQLSVLLISYVGNSLKELSIGKVENKLLKILQKDIINVLS